MINVYPLKGGYRNGFMVTGHAQYAEIGTDIVCAAVSAITQTTAIGLERYTQSERNISGEVLVMKVEKPSIRSSLLIDVMLLGLRDIQKQYSKHITIWKDEFSE